MPLVVLAVLTRADRRPPPLVVAVPLDRPLEPLIEADLRLPAELRAQLVARQGVAAVVAGAVAHVLDQRRVPAGQLQDAPDHVEVLALVRSAHVVGLARTAAEQHGVDGAAEVLHVEPVAYLAPSPYTGRGSPLRAFSTHSGISFSGYWRGP